MYIKVAEKFKRQREIEGRVFEDKNGGI